MKRLLPLILIVILFIFLATAKIKNVTCSVKNSNCDQQQLNQTNDALKNKSLFFLDIKKEINKNKEFSKNFILVSYKKELLSTIHLELLKREPLYQVAIDDKVFLVTKQGNLLNILPSDSNLPTLNWQDKNSDLVDNNQIKAQTHQQIVELITSLTKLDIKVKEIKWLNNEKIILILDNNLHFILDTKVINTKAKAVKLIVESKEVQSIQEPIKEIDLRFKLPVLHITQ